MSKILLSEISRIKKIMGINEEVMPDFMQSKNLFGEASPAPAQPDQSPDVDTPTRTHPGKPDRKHPFKPKPIVKPNPKAIGESDNEDESAQQLNEFPMTFQGPERPAHDIERAMADKTTGFSRNPGIPPAGGEPGQTGEELLASERFQQVVEKMRELTGTTDQNTIMGIIMGCLSKVVQFERQHKEELEALAEQLVKEELGDATNEIIYDITLIRPNNEHGDFAKEVTQQQDASELSEDELEDEGAAFELFQQFDQESAKRRIINAFIQGAAMKGHFLIQKPEAVDLLNGMAGAIAQELINSYAILMTATEYQYWTIPDMEAMVGGGSNVEGKNSVEYNEDEEKWVVHAQASLFPILVHETLKGTLEVIGQHGVPDDPKMAKAVIDREDILYKEVWDMRLGPIIWQKFRMALPFELLEDTQTAKRLLLYVLMEFFSLPVNRFLETNRRMLEGDSQPIVRIVEKVKRAFYEESLEDAEIEELEQDVNDEFNRIINDDEFDIYSDPLFRDLLSGLNQRSNNQSNDNLTETIKQIKRRM